MLLSWITVVLALVAWGAHGAMAPAFWRASELPKSSWRLWALPLALSSLTLSIGALRLDLDTVLAAGLGPGLPPSWTARGALALLVLALLSDAALFAAGNRLSSIERRIVGACGALGALGSALVGELLRNAGASTIWPLLAATTACRLGISLGAGETLSAARPRLGVLAAAGLILYPFLLPSRLGSTLALGGDGLTVAAATLLFASARWLPRSLRRPALIAATLLAALLLQRAAALSAAFSTQAPLVLSSGE
ncbi:MAG: hypothetical protein ABI609_03420 [Acidobacteriota bacterium]